MTGEYYAYIEDETSSQHFALNLGDDDFLLYNFTHQFGYKKAWLNTFDDKKAYVFEKPYALVCSSRVVSDFYDSKIYKSIDIVDKEKYVFQWLWHSLIINNCEGFFNYIDADESFFSLHTTLFQARLEFKGQSFFSSFPESIKQ